MANARPQCSLRREDRTRFLGQLQAGIRSKYVAYHINVRQNTFVRLRPRHQANASVKDLPGSGRPKVTTQREDCYIALTAGRRSKSPRTSS